MAADPKAVAPLAAGRADQIATLTRINADDFCESFGARPGSPPWRALSRLIWPAAHAFARLMIVYDGQVCQDGLAGAAAGVVDRLAGPVEVTGSEKVPTDGPILYVSNHPGLTDTVVLFANLPRGDDLRVIAAERPFLCALPCTGRHMLYIREGSATGGVGAARAAAAHLRGGRSLLTFPAGNIEPDPACMPGAAASLENWSTSLALLARLVPETTVVPVLVSGVIAPGLLRHPLVRLRRQPRDRERLAASLQLALQVALPTYRPLRVRLAFGTPLCGVDLARLHDTTMIMEAVAGEVRRLLERESNQSYNNPIQAE